MSIFYDEAEFVVMFIIVVMRLMEGKRSQDIKKMLALINDKEWSKKFLENKITLKIPEPDMDFTEKAEHLLIQLEMMEPSQKEMVAKIFEEYNDHIYNKKLEEQRKQKEEGRARKGAKDYDQSKNASISR